jgi:hypothetical protein
MEIIIPLVAPAKSKLSAVHFLVWLAIVTITAVAIAAVAFAAAQVAAPLVLFPLLVGGLLGGSLVLAMRIAQIGHRPTLMIGTVLAALLVVVGQHYASYLSDLRSVAEAREKFNEKIASSAAGISPELFADHVPQAAANFADYMRKQADAGRPITARLTLLGAYAWASWILDGLIECVAALWIVWWAAQPAHR